MSLSSKARPEIRTFSRTIDTGTGEQVFCFVSRGQASTPILPTGLQAAELARSVLTKS